VWQAYDEKNDDNPLEIEQKVWEMGRLDSQSFLELSNRGGGIEPRMLQREDDRTNLRELSRLSRTRPDGSDCMETCVVGKSTCSLLCSTIISQFGVLYAEDPLYDWKIIPSTCSDGSTVQNLCAFRVPPS